MNHRELGGVGAVSEVGYGAWQIGGDWGEVTGDEAVAAVEAARDAGVDFFDITGSRRLPVSCQT